MKRTTIDLRSDTVTRPTPNMRRAMAEAEVGDDAYGDDPTVNELQRYAAEIFGREASLFVPSGTMANQIAIKIYAGSGQEVICEERAHIFNVELGMMSAFAGCLARTVCAQKGILAWGDIAPLLRRLGSRYGSTALIALENTSNFPGGTVYPIQGTREICEQAHQANVPVYLDGARIFNAAVALEVPVAEATRGFDAFMFSLSKGLGAPAGSLLVGDVSFIEEARLVRQMLGGGMRQAGILAAAGLIALKEGPSHLPIDHENAKFLAAELAGFPGLSVDVESIVTNIVMVETSGSNLHAPQLVKVLAQRGVLANAIDLETVRLVTHRDVTRAECCEALQIFREVLAIAFSQLVYPKK